MTQERLTEYGVTLLRYLIVLSLAQFLVGGGRYALRPSATLH